MLNISCCLMGIPPSLCSCDPHSFWVRPFLTPYCCVGRLLRPRPPSHIPTFFTLFLNHVYSSVLCHITSYTFVVLRAFLASETIHTFEAHVSAKGGFNEWQQIRQQKPFVDSERGKCNDMNVTRKRHVVEGAIGTNTDWPHLFHLPSLLASFMTTIL